MEASEEDEGEVDHEGVTGNEKELGIEVDQIELIVRVAKGTLIRSRSVGVDILT